MRAFRSFLLAALALVALTAADSVVTAQPQPKLRTIRRSEQRLGIFGTVMTIDGDSVASTRVRMRRGKPPYLLAHAEYMSVGPRGAIIPDTSSGPGIHVDDSVFHRLRVTLCSYERSTRMIIDDIVTGRAGTRTVSASYVYSPFGDYRYRDLRAALREAPRVMGPDPTPPPITWFSPTSFALVTQSDTLVFEQKADSVFQMTIRARVR